MPVVVGLPARRAGSSRRSRPCAVQRVVAVAVAVPDVDGGADERRARSRDPCTVSLMVSGHALGRRRRRAEAAADVAAHDARVVEDVHAVGAVARVGAGRLVRRLDEVGVGRRRRRPPSLRSSLPRRGRRGRADARRRSGRGRRRRAGAARGERTGDAEAAEERQRPTPVDERLEVVDEPAVVVLDLVAVLVEPLGALGARLGAIVAPSVAGPAGRAPPGSSLGRRPWRPRCARCASCARGRAPTSDERAQGEQVGLQAEARRSVPVATPATTDVCRNSSRAAGLDRCTSTRLRPLVVTMAHASRTAYE